MPAEGNKILKYNHGKKSLRAPFIIIFDLKCQLKKEQSCLRNHCHYTGKFRGAAHSICNLSYKVPKEIPVVIHNGSTCDYHFVIKQLAEEFKSQFECLGENTKKYITFSVPIKKEVPNGKEEEVADNGKKEKEEDNNSEKEEGKDDDGKK